MNVIIYIAAQTWWFDLVFSKTECNSTTAEMDIACRMLLPISVCYANLCISCTHIPDTQAAAFLLEPPDWLLSTLLCPWDPLRKCSGRKTRDLLGLQWFGRQAAAFQAQSCSVLSSRYSCQWETLFGITWVSQAQHQWSASCDMEHLWIIFVE